MATAGDSSRITISGLYAFVVQNPAEHISLSSGQDNLDLIQQVVRLAGDLAFSSRRFDSSSLNCQPMINTF